MRSQRSYIFLLVLVFLLVSLFSPTAAPEGKKAPSPQEVAREAVRQLLKSQEEGGVWPYECTCSEEEQTGPAIGLRVGSTSIVAEALLFAAPDDKEVRAAVQRALAFVLEQLDDPDMAPLTEDAYDVRIWGQGYALEFLCHVRACNIVGPLTKKVKEWIPRLVRTLIKEEIPDGGWNYGTHAFPATFVTAPITQALLLARSQGEKVPDEVFKRSRDVLERARSEKGAFNYNSGRKDDDDSKPAQDEDDTFDPGSAGRSPVCETTLRLLGGGSIKAVRSALNNFHEYWDELEERRQKPGNHGGKYGIAPYYFYYAHRYAAQAIQILPEKERAKERERLLKPILQTRSKDGTWNDCVFERARNFGTAMVVLALLGDKAPLPPKFVTK